MENLALNYESKMLKPIITKVEYSGVDKSVMTISTCIGDNVYSSIFNDSEPFGILNGRESAANMRHEITHGLGCTLFKSPLGKQLLWKFMDDEGNGHNNFSGEIVTIALQRAIFAGNRECFIDKPENEESESLILTNSFIQAYVLLFMLSIQKVSDKNEIEEIGVFLNQKAEEIANKLWTNGESKTGITSQSRSDLKIEFPPIEFLSDVENLSIIAPTQEDFNNFCKIYRPHQFDEQTINAIHAQIPEAIENILHDFR
jgi:hypothetical protein